MSVNSTVKQLQRHASAEHLGKDALLWRISGVLGPAADPLFHTLCNELDWQQPVLRLYGRQHPVPRLTCWLGEAGVEYRYSGLAHRARGWPRSLSPLLEQLTRLTQRRPNGVLANLYRDGDDAMGWHSDDEAELGPAPWILSYSLGAQRELAFRPIGSSRQSRTIVLHHDELLVMAPTVQRHFQHALPRRRRVREPRLNLTFREIVPHG